MATCVEELSERDRNTAEDDLTLVHATKSGHAPAFEKLVWKYDRRLLRIAQSVTRNREEAEDAVQEAFFNAYQRLDQFQETAKFSTWLIRIVLNEGLFAPCYKIRTLPPGKNMRIIVIVLDGIIGACFLTIFALAI